MRRTTNQDSHALLLADTPELLQQRGHLLMVADGMGAHAAGELASKLATDGVPFLYHKYGELSPPEALARALRETNTEIHRRGSANPDFHNMGTTGSALVLLPQGAIAAHIGDSRIYRLRGRTISQLTFDHSLQWELKASGHLPPEADLSAIVPKNVITRSLGPNPSVQIDLEGPFPIAQGDVYLLCSDGLTGRVEDAELGAILASLPPHEAAQALVDLANLRGGPDNTTVLIGRVVGPELVSPANAPPAPLHVGRPTNLQPVSVVIWIGAAVLALAALVLALIQQYLAAGVALAVAAIDGLVGLMLRLRGASGVAPLAAGQSLGKGPYASVDCSPNRELVRKLAATLDELREAAHDGEWTINWQPLDEACEKALAAGQSGNFAEAVRQYCRAISHVMSELRMQGPKKPPDSAI
jgi:serine/threonine protein phosphatase PrpC